jgi:hypothetical protein
MTLTDFFDKIYCINLDRRLDRWIKVNEEFRKHKFTNVERYPAIDGTKIKNNTKLLNGELGILLTHIDLIKKCKTENIDSVLIFEDDVVFSPEIKNVRSIFNDIPENWDMIYFGGNHKYGDTPKKIVNNVYRLNYSVSLHCVAIRHTIYNEILSILQNKEKQVDNYYTEIQKTRNVYGIIPNLAFQTQDFSDIQNKIVNYDYLLK